MGSIMRRRGLMQAGVSAVRSGTARLLWLIVVGASVMLPGQSNQARAQAPGQGQPQGGGQAADKPRVIVLTDISNEPDDEQSLVRFLAYANEFDVEGLVATTSTWLKNKTREDLIRRSIKAYGEVYSNLIKHAALHGGTPAQSHCDGPIRLRNEIRRPRQEHRQDQSCLSKPSTRTTRGPSG